MKAALWTVTVAASLLAMAEVARDDSFEAKRAAALGRPRTVIWNTDGNDMVCYPRNLPCTPEVFETLRLKYARGTKINTVSYCPHASGFGWFTTRKTHDFMASDVISDDGKIHNAAGDFAKIGTDALEMAASFCRREGLEIFVSIRMNDTHDNKGSGEPPDPGLFSSFKRRHPECLMGSITNSPRFCAWTAVDFARPAVREHVRRFVREFLENYDLDGIEYDFFRHLQLLKTVANGADATSAELDMMTELMRQLREIAEEAGRKRGRPFLVAVRVPDSMGFCCAVGIDIERWMKERLVDIVIGSGYFQLNPWHVMADAAHRAGCRFYASLDEPRCVSSRAPLGFLPGRGKKIAFYRAREAAAMAEGADGVVLFNLEQGRLPPIANLDPCQPGGMAQDYFAVPRATAFAQFWHYCARPDRFLNMPAIDPQRHRRIDAGETYDFDLVVGDEPASYRQPRKVTAEVLTNATDGNEIGLAVNGESVARTAFADRVFTFDVPARLVRKGRNRISVSAGNTPIRVADFVLRIAEPQGK